MCVARSLKRTNSSSPSSFVLALGKECKQWTLIDVQSVMYVVFLLLFIISYRLVKMAALNVLYFSYIWPPYTKTNSLLQSHNSKQSTSWSRVVFYSSVPQTVSVTILNHVYQGSHASWKITNLFPGAGKCPRIWQNLEMSWKNIALVNNNITPVKEILNCRRKKVPVLSLDIPCWFKFKSKWVDQTARGVEEAVPEKLQ